METLDRRLQEDPRFTSAPASFRAYLENQELRAEVNKLRSEVEKLWQKFTCPLRLFFQQEKAKEFLLAKIDELVARWLERLKPFSRKEAIGLLPCRAERLDGKDSPAGPVV